MNTQKPANRFIYQSSERTGTKYTDATEAVSAVPFVQEHERKQRSRVYSNFMLVGTGNRSLSNDVFERHTSTGSGLFAVLRHDFEQIF